MIKAITVEAVIAQENILQHRFLLRLPKKAQKYLNYLSLNFYNYCCNYNSYSLSKRATGHR